MINKAIITLIKENFALNWHGIHGVAHWARVRRNGLIIAKDNGANRRVIGLFAFFHDSQRLDDNYDQYHGYRAAEFISSLSCKFLNVTMDERMLLIAACRHHTDRDFKTANITILSCWDADALDLGRVGIKPDPDRLHTKIGKKLAKN